jgi:hypothetical protein
VLSPFFFGSFDLKKPKMNPGRHAATRVKSIPPQPGFYRLDSPKEIGFYPVHLGGEALCFFPRVEHDLVVDLSCSELFIFPHRLSHVALPSAG